MCEEWLANALIELITKNQEILKNQELMFEELNRIQTGLKQLDAKFDEKILVGARNAVQHLLDGMNSDIEDVQHDEFLMAREEFSTLIHLDPEETTMGTSCTVDNKLLICIGYWGSYHYFNLRDDKRNALIQVYKCAEKYPMNAIKLFSPNFFSRDYEALIREDYERLDAAKNRLQELEGADFDKTISYYCEWIKKIGCGAATAIGAASAIMGLPPVVSVIIVKAGAEEYDKIHPVKPLPTDTSGLEREISKLTTEIENYICDVCGECEMRLHQLQKLPKVTFEEVLITAQQQIS